MDLHEIISQLKRLASDLGRTPTTLEFIANSNVSQRQISKHKYSNLCKMAGLKPNQNSQQKPTIRIEERPPRILIFDIETAPMKAFVYGLWDQNIPLKSIEKDWFMFSFAAKWAGENDIFYKDTSKRKDVSNDYYVCKELHKLLSQADIVVGQKEEKRTIKKANARFIKHGFDPIPQIQQIDTLKIARKYFKFTSNKLDYIAQYLGIEGKYKSPKYSGMDLWIACYNKNMEAFEEMEIYNKQDVEITEKVFDKLKTWHAPLNFQAFYQTATCICGSTNFNKDGVRYTKQSAFQRYKCAECGKHYTGKENLINKDTRKDFFK